MISGRLISRSCTTSWSDWNHGDLYLTAEALVRVRLPVPTAEGRRLRDTVGPTPRYRDLPSADEAGPLLDLDPTNRCIRLTEITSARLRRGAFNDRLALTLQDGTRSKLLWLRVDPAYDVLARELPDRLGTAFRRG